MLVLEFRFLSGRYHATKWGRNTNEGLVDWPPSPWRILRAIISAWKTSAADIEESKMIRILESMCGSEVLFYIPKALQGHTRHYVPIKKTTEKMIDSFVVMNRDDYVLAGWKGVDLDEEQKNIMDRVLGSIRYLGRAESWCRVSMSESMGEPNCTPLGRDTGSEDKEIIDVLVPNRDTTLADLCVNVKDLRKDKTIYPNGSSVVQYVRPRDSLLSLDVRAGLVDTQGVNTIRYAITGRVRPKVTESLPVGDFIKRIAMSSYGRSNPNEMSQTLTGRDGNRRMLKSGHTHAFYLPTDEDGDNVLDHVTITAAEPFSQKEIRALEITNVARYGNGWFNLVYQARGMAHEFDTVPILQSAKKWKSATPYVLNRHMKVRGRQGHKKIVDGPEDQLRREIRNRFGDVRIRDIRIFDSKSAMKCGIMPIEFKRWRKDRLAGFGAYDVRIEFEEEISGPLSFGHGAHYGLGMFVPQDT